MTREEALNRNNYMVNFIDENSKAFSEEALIKHLNKIYDDFENRTCDNCNHLEIDYGRKKCKNDMPVWNLDRGCDCWEQIQ